MGSLTRAYPKDLFKPQWAYPTPEGSRDEPYLVPFKFQVPADGLLHLNFPWSLDDDVPYIIRGIIFPAIGTAQPLFNQIPPLAFPGLCRIWDTHGNPLSDGLVLALGVWAQSGFSDAVTPTGINAFGFPIEPEIVCSPGGALMFDFQLNTNAMPASLVYTVGGGSITFVFRTYGTVGNTWDVLINDPGAPNSPLTAIRAGNTIVVFLATDGASALISTLADVAAIVNSTAQTAVQMAAILSGDGTVIATALGLTALAGGAAQTDELVDLTGTLIGVKRFPECDE